MPSKLLIGVRPECDWIRRELWRTQQRGRGAHCTVAAAFLLALSSPLWAQTVNSGSDGSDGDLNPTQNITIDMADHPDGIYQYHSVNIPAGVTVSFTPNEANAPVIWLVQESCVIAGTVNVDGKDPIGTSPGLGGPGGFRGGNGPATGVPPGAGLGPGGGRVTGGASLDGGQGGFGNPGSNDSTHHPGGDAYGDPTLLLLVGGSGAGGGTRGGGGGGGGAILIVASHTITLGGAIVARGGDNYGGGYCSYSSAGSGGAVRLVASSIVGSGNIFASAACNNGDGRIRLEAFTNNHTGIRSGVVTTGTPSVIMLPESQTPQARITSIAGIPVTTSQGGSPHVFIPGNQANPMPVGIVCERIPLGTEITVEVKPENGPDLRYTGLNNSGTYDLSTATVLVNILSRNGTIQAKTTSDLLALGPTGGDGKVYVSRRSRFARGWTASGESFQKAELTTALGGLPQLVLITDSGERYPISASSLRTER